MYDPQPLAVSRGSGELVRMGQLVETVRHSVRCQYRG